VRGLRRIAALPYPYVIFYAVTAEDVVIIGVRHAARKPAPV
jgi:toxin ParE1/3/4